MRRGLKNLLILLTLAMTCWCSGVMAAKARTSEGNAGAEYRDVLDFHGAPSTPTDRSFNIFFDAGAWHGYRLPPKNDPGTGFIGPFVHSLHGGRWAGRRFARVALRDADGSRLVLHKVAGHAAPGYLVRRFAGDGLTLRETLFFADSRHALVRIRLRSTRARDVHMAVTGRLMPGLDTHLARAGRTVVQTFAGSHSKLVTRLRAGSEDAYRIRVDKTGYRIAPDEPLHLRAGHARTLFVEQTLWYDARAAASSKLDPAAAWAGNRARWHGYLKSARTCHLPGLADALARRVCVKAMITLLGNWRAPRGDLHHGGVIPSYSNPDFNGFWAWDSWKHAAALAWFAPHLAREQMRAMFDAQAADGMVPDVIYLHKADDNWRNTKPPLAAWATLNIYRATHDKAFLAWIYPRLVRYHRWWYRDRDHDHDGLAEYGSTDGTKVAARWESGMDNAVRFDHIRMLKNHAGAWSMNQESADLNAYLYRAKRDLAIIAGILGKPAERKRWNRQADALEQAIQTRLFDKSRGFFFDIKLGSGKFVPVFGSDGWIPLWAGAARPAQARAVEKVMLDKHKFDTFMPLPTLAADDPHFAPVKGYWRGPIWLDQAYFGIMGLRRYGHDHRADALARRLLLRARGLTRQATFRENYDPLTGKGYQSRNFSWSAASGFLLLHGQGR